MLFLPFSCLDISINSIQVQKLPSFFHLHFDTSFGLLSVRRKAKNLRDGFCTLNTFSFVLIQKKQKIKARDCFLVRKTFTSYNFSSTEPFHPLLSRCFVGDFSTTSKKNAAQFGAETETSKCQELDIFVGCLRDIISTGCGFESAPRGNRMAQQEIIK